MATTLNLHNSPLSLTLHAGELVYVCGPNDLNLDLHLDFLLPGSANLLLDQVALLEPNKGWQHYQKAGYCCAVGELLLEWLETSGRTDLSPDLLLETLDLQYTKDALASNLSEGLALRLYALELLLEGKNVLLFRNMGNSPKLLALLAGLKQLLADYNLPLALVLVTPDNLPALKGLADRTEDWNSLLLLQPGAAA